MNGYILIPKSRSTPVSLECDMRISLAHPPRHGYIRRLVGCGSDRFAVHYPGGSSLRGRLSISLFESLIPIEGNGLVGIAHRAMDLQKTQSRSAVMQIERERFALLMGTQLAECVVQQAHIVRHSSGDGHQLVSVYRLENQ